MSKGVMNVTRRYGIGILLCTAIMCGAYWVSYQYIAEEPEVQIEESTEEVKTAPVNANNDEQVYKYYLREVDGVVYVYLGDKETLFETTSISVNQLPEALREEIKKGKPLQDEHELYNFLENYSS